MDPKILAIVALVVVGGIVAAVFIGGGGETTPSNESTSQETTNQPSGSSTTTSSQGGSSTSTSIEGTWEGTYTSPYGQGTWKWVIKETNTGEYTGCLTATGPYAIDGWVPITINVEGNQITLGTSGVLQLVFTGTISGESASGSWHIVGRTDNGNWQGTRTSSDTTLPCFGGSEGETTTTPSGTTTPPGGTTTTTSPSNLGCSPSPSTTLENAYTTLSQAMIAVFGADNLSCVNVPYSNETIYQFLLFIYGYSGQDVNTIGNMLGSELESLGWTNVTVIVPQPYMIEINGYYYDNSYIINATIGIALAPTQSGANIVLMAEPSP